MFAALKCDLNPSIMLISVDTTLVQATITSCLGFHNSLLSGLLGPILTPFLVYFQQSSQNDLVIDESSQVTTHIKSFQDFPIEPRI